MFRIERRLVNLATARSILVDTDEYEAGAAGDFLDAAASAAALVQTQAQARAKEIISEAEAEAKTNAETIIEDARREAAALMLSMREQSEEDRRQAIQEGFAEGSEEGRHAYDERLSAKMREYDEQLDAKMREYDEKLAAKLREDDDELKHVLKELYDERKRAFDGLEDEVVGLALGIVRKIISPVEEGSGEMFNALIRNALKQMNPDGKIVIRVSQAEYDRFFPTGGAVFKMDSGVKLTAAIIKDPQLGDGDCIIDADETTVNAGLDSQLKYVQLTFDQVES